MKPAIPAFAVALLIAGCSAYPPAAPVPPPLPAEIVPLPPVSATPLVWQPSDWAWSNGSYRYEPGGYVPLMGHGRDWVFGHWAGPRGQYVWVPGQWN